jgi:SAM-dependent methyltransferase
MITWFLKRFAANSSRAHLATINARFAATIPPGALVLDAGAGEAPYRPMLAHTRYESADFEKLDKRYAPSTYVCDLGAIPVEDNRFDFVLLNQVLEHLPEPEHVLKELHRVLKPGGKMICTAPLFYEEHETPYDFFRYTQFAYRHIFTKAGFTIEAIEWLEGYFGTVAYQLDTAARYLPVRPSAIAPGPAGYVASPFLLVLKLLFALTAVAFYKLDIRAPYKGKGYPKNYAVIASRPAQETVRLPSSSPASVVSA